MKITSINIYNVKNKTENKTALASIIIDDCIAIHDIKINDKNNNIKIAMPSRVTTMGKTKEIVQPLVYSLRASIYDVILDAYKNSNV